MSREGRFDVVSVRNKFLTDECGNTGREGSTTTALQGKVVSREGGVDVVRVGRKVLTDVCVDTGREGSTTTTLQTSSNTGCIGFNHLETGGDGQREAVHTTANSESDEGSYSERDGCHSRVGCCSEMFGVGSVAREGRGRG